MTSNSIRLGSLFGVPIGVNYSWFVILLLTVLSLETFLEVQHPFWTELQRWSTAAVASLLFFASVVAHEMSHSLVARRRGIPVRGITLFIFGGVSRLSMEASSPRAELVIALVGPLTSIALGLVFLLLALVLPADTPAMEVAVVLAQVNLVLGVFNLLPGFPLDGGRVLRSLVWAMTSDFHRATSIATTLGRGLAFLMILGGVAFAFTYSFATGIWMALIGWFLEMAASSSARHLRLQDALQGFTARDMMGRGCPQVSPQITLQELVDNVIMVSGLRCFAVAENGPVEGIVTLSGVKDVPRHQWGVTVVRQVMVPVDRMKAVAPQESALRVLELMDEADVNQVPVIQDGQIMGLVSRDGVLHFLRLRAELGMQDV